MKCVTRSSYKNFSVVVLTVEINFIVYVQYVKYVKKSIFEYFLKFIIGMSSCLDEFLHLKMKRLMFLEVFCTKNESFSFDIHVILDPQILCIFLQKICGIMTFWVDFDFKVTLMGGMILRLWKGWCNLFSVNFIHNNSMFFVMYIRIFEKSHFYRISCVGFLIPLVNMCWLDVDQILIFEKYDVWWSF